MDACPLNKPPNEKWHLTNACCKCGSTYRGLYAKILVELRKLAWVW